MRYLSACLCFRNSAGYLAEWLAFYEGLGVEYFYLFNNDSADDFAGVIEPYLQRGRAVCLHHGGPAQQQVIYDRCLALARGATRWLMFCDDDEYLFPVEDIPLPDALLPYERYAGVAACWMLYGASGHQQRPPGLTIASYLTRAPYPDHHVKCIVDPTRVERSRLIGHSFVPRAGEVIVDENERPLMEALHPQPTAAILRINHYVTRSIAEMVARRSAIQADTGQRSSLSLDQWRELEAGWNAVHDPIAARYATRVVARIAETRQERRRERLRSFLSGYAPRRATDTDRRLVI